MSTLIKNSKKNIEADFKQDQFNTEFIKKDTEDQTKYKIIQEENTKKIQDIYDKLLPHQRTLGEIILSIRKLFFTCLEMLLDYKNPLPYIYSTATRQFDFTLLVIIISILLLLLSSMLK